MKNKLFKFLCLLVTGLAASFAPMQMSALEAQGICCAGCAMKKEEEEDRVEVVIEEDDIQ